MLMVNSFVALAIGLMEMRESLWLAPPENDVKIFKQLILVLSVAFSQLQTMQTITQLCNSPDDHEGSQHSHKHATKKQYPGHQEDLKS
jgi:hypothetical protein